MIGLLDASHYLRPLRRILLGAHHVHIAQVDFNGHTAPAYVKVYPPGTGGLIGEALGFAAAYQSGIERPAHAAIIQLPAAALKNLDPPAWIKGHQHVWAWCCELVEGTTIAHLYRAGQCTENLWRDVLASKDAGKILGLDEWLSNGDRNEGALLRLGRKRWAVIDHGEAMGSHLWPIMGPHDCGETILLKQSRQLLDQEDFVTLRAAAASLSEIHRKTLAAINAPLVAFMVNELRISNTVATGAVAFLQSRLGPSWMRDRLGLLV